MSDIDIAVRADQARAALACLAAAGWQPDAPVTNDDLAFRHALTLRGPGGRELDLHWHILFERCDAEADALFWDHVEKLAFHGTACCTPGPELSLLHAIAHGLRANPEPPIRWIADAMTILRTARPCFDWGLFASAAERLGLARRLALGLDYLRRQHGAEVPPEVLAALARVRPPHAERLEIATMLRATPGYAPMLWRKLALLLAEFMRLNRRRSWLAGAATLPGFVRYRAGVKSWRGALLALARRRRRAAG